MSKPTIFFSHSSKDSEQILKIKNALNLVTGGTLDIFMSSDGQSIRFGTNWVHKIEDGLNTAQIMFVFITPNSIQSNWIYFEAGYAYSKNIDVIPVGLGINIEVLKPPLNLLQGFNISSKDSFNNVITIINDKLDVSHSGRFTEEQFKTIQYNGNQTLVTDVRDYFSSVEFFIYDETETSSGEKIIHDCISIFKKIEDYLKSNSFNYSLQESYRNPGVNCILVSGIKISLFTGIEEMPELGYTETKSNSLKFEISMYNFFESFGIFIKILEHVDHREWIYLTFVTNPNYSLVHKVENLSAIVSRYPEIFSLDSNEIGSIKFMDKEINFHIPKKYYKYVKGKESYLLGVSFKISNSNIDNIINLLVQIIKTNIIFEND